MEQEKIKMCAGCRSVLFVKGRCCSQGRKGKEGRCGVVLGTKEGHRGAVVTRRCCCCSHAECIGDEVHAGIRSMEM